MLPVRVYGHEMLQLISLRHDVTEEFDYQDLDASTKDVVLIYFTANANKEMFGDCLLGEGNFGPLVAEFKTDPRAYIAALDCRMANEARKGASAEDLADLLGCEELTNEEAIRRSDFGENLFDIFCKSHGEFYALASDLVAQYMTRQLVLQLEEALPAFLEERREAARNLMEYAA